MACEGKPQRDSKGRFVASSKKPVCRGNKAEKARAQRRDAKGHFIPGYKSDVPELNTKNITMPLDSVITITGCTEGVSEIEQVPTNWYQKLGEVADKLTLVVSGLNKLVDFKDYISGNKKDK